MESVQPREQRTISLFVANNPGVLIRIALLFSRRGYNLDSVVVSPAYKKGFSRMSVVVTGDGRMVQQIINQLNKLVEVVHATDHTGQAAIEQELVLVKVRCLPEQRTEILQVADHFKCESVDLSPETITFKATGGSDKLDALHAMLDSYGILESVRSGKLIMSRGSLPT